MSSQIYRSIKAKWSEVYKGLREWRDMELLNQYSVLVLQDIKVFVIFQ